MYRRGLVTLSKNTAPDYKRILQKCQAGGVPPLSIASPVGGLRPLAIGLRACRSRWSISEKERGQGKNAFS
jgi:hypothetical protein